MANGLLDYLSTPQGVGLLSGIATYAANARRGTPVNNIGRGVAGGIVGYGQAQDAIDQEKEKAFERQFSQQRLDIANAQLKAMQEKAANEQAMRANLLKLYDPGQQGGQYPADNAFDEPLGNDRMVARPPTFAGQAVDPAIAAVLPYANPDEILKYMRPGAQDKTSEIKNFEYGQALPDGQREQFFANNKTGMPSTVQEWEYFSKLPPEQQKAFIEMKRSPTVLNLGGFQAVREPVSGGIGEKYYVTPKPEDMPGFKAAQTAATEQAKADVDLSVDAAKKTQKSVDMTNYINKAEDLLNKASGGYIGAAVAKGKQALNISDETTQANQQLKLISGWMVANVPRMEGPQSDYDVQNYKTMAAQVGDETVPIGDRRAALNTLRNLQQKYTTPQDKSAAYKEYLDAYARAKTPEQKKMVNERARKLGVIK